VNEQDQNDGWGIPKKVETKPKKIQDDDGWRREEVQVVQPKKAEVYNVKKNVNEDDDWDKELESPPKKNVKKVEVKEKWLG